MYLSPDFLRDLGLLAKELRISQQRNFFVTEGEGATHAEYCEQARE
jgi:hypothetical protein